VMIRTMENNIILSPPLIVTDAHVEKILDALDRALSEV
jgi:adenosylmethionine-8-amino-7-oxononanoate aminotransferase